MQDTSDGRSAGSVMRWSLRFNDLANIALLEIPRDVLIGLMLGAMISLAMEGEPESARDQLIRDVCESLKRASEG